MKRYGNQGISMREIAEVAGVTTQTLLNSIRLLEPYVEQLEAEKKERKHNCESVFVCFAGVFVSKSHIDKNTFWTGTKKQKSTKLSFT